MTAANFASPVLPFTLKYEGGEVDDPRDPGGRTNQGVTQRTYAAHRKAAGLPPADVFTMTDAERDAIYRTGFWQAIGGDTLPDGVDLACFDFAVNSGPARALNALQHAGGVAAASADPEAMVKAICAARLSFLHALGTFRIFGRGWTARVAACEALGVKMALHERWAQPADAPPTRSAALVLSHASRTAARAATRHRAAAGASGIAAAAMAAASPALGTPGHAGAPLATAAASAILALLAAALGWRGRQKATLAGAYADAAR